MLVLFPFFVSQLWWFKKMVLCQIIKTELGKVVIRPDTTSATAYNQWIWWDVVDHWFTETHVETNRSSKSSLGADATVFGCKVCVILAPNPESREKPKEKFGRMFHGFCPKRPTQNHNSCLLHGITPCNRRAQLKTLFKAQQSLSV